jgi:hypothetical protein
LQAALYIWWFRQFFHPVSPSAPSIFGFFFVKTWIKFFGKIPSQKL